MDRWIEVGPYDDVLALVLRGDLGDALAFTITADVIETPDS